MSAPDACEGNPPPGGGLHRRSHRRPRKGGRTASGRGPSSASPGITEHLKRNAPSYCFQGDDRVTFKLRPAKGVQLIFHRGAKVKDAASFRFEDDTGLLRWLAKDRGIVSFSTEKELRSARGALKKLVKRWMEATSVRGKRPGGRSRAGNPDFAPVMAAFSELPGILPGRMGSLTHRGKIFAMPFRGRLVVKLPAERVKSLSAQGKGQPFRMGHRVMSEWFQFEGPSKDWVPLAKEAHAFVASLAAR